MPSQSQTVQKFSYHIVTPITGANFLLKGSFSAFCVIYIAVGNSLRTNFVTQKRSELCEVHTLVPIVKGERKRRKREEQTKKRYRKKPTDTVRLCADDIMTRLKLKSYQDTYAEAMAKYGLQMA